MSIYLGGSYGRPPSTRRALRALRRIHLSIVSSAFPQGPDAGEGEAHDHRRPSPNFSPRSAGGADASHAALPVPAGRGDLP